MSNFQFQATIDGVKTLKNNSLKVSLETQDIASYSPEELSRLFKLNDKLAWVAISELEVKPEDIEIKAEPTLKKEKSKSQKLRDVMYVLWEQKGINYSSKLFYDLEMDKITEHYKSKLE